MATRKLKRCRVLFFIFKMSNAWIIWGIGVLFCFSGLYLFFKNVYEEGKSIKWPVMVILMGVLIIAAGTAKYFELFN
jgi:hypothetical protein